MSYILLVFLFYMVIMASAEHTPEDVSQYGNYSTFRKALCEKDEEMYKEMDACFKLEHRKVQDAHEECVKKADPESGGDAVAFVISACSNGELFLKFDDCFDEYKAKPDFREQMEKTPEIEACYDKVLEKYEMADR